MNAAVEHIAGLSEDTAARCALVLVTHTRGSTPRHPGTAMVIGPGTEQFGTIGGGRVEEVVTRAAHRAADTGETEIVTHHLVRDLAMCCGGSMTFLVTPLAPHFATLVDVAATLANRGRVDLCWPLDGTPVRAEAPTAPRPVADEDQFTLPLRPRPRAILFGFGHLARALGPMLGELEFDVVVCDDGETDAMVEPPTWADRVVDSFDLRDVERAVGRLGPDDYAIIFTRDHAIDQAILEHLLPRTELGYLGLIGSLGKVGRFRKRLVAKGIADDERWARLDAPMGLSIGAESPAEIAVSIAAGLVQRRRRP